MQSGIGNLGTHSVIDTARVAAEVLDMPWDRVEVVWGDTSRNLPWTCTSDGSQTMHAMSRSNHAGAMDAKRKLLEIAAKDLGGRPEDYGVGGARVYHNGDRSRHLTFEQAAQRAIKLGGKFDGHELPSDIHAITRASATALAGQGVMGVAKDNYPHDGETHSYVVGFAEVEVDVETGTVKLLDYAAVADVGTVVNPRGLGGQVLGGSCLGIGHALTQKTVYDQQYGVPLAMRFHYNKPLTILDVPPDGMRHAARRSSRSGNAGRRARRRRAAGRRRRRCGPRRDHRRGWRRRVPADSGDAGRDSGVARGRAPGARRADAVHLAGRRRP